MKKNKEDMTKMHQKLSRITRPGLRPKDVHMIITDKNFIKEQEFAINSKSDLKFIRQLVSNQEEISKSVENIHKILNTKPDAELFKKHLNTCEEIIEILSKDLLLKADKKELCVLLDSKLNKNDFKSAIHQLRLELENTVLLDEFNLHLADQNLINEALYSENCLAR